MATVAGNSLTVAITIAQAFILIPLSLAHLGPAIYGAWFAASELLVWVQTIDGGVPNLLTQRVGAAMGRGDTEEAAHWSSTGLISLLLVGACLGAVALLMAPLVSGWAQVPGPQQGEFVACFRIGVAASTLLLFSNGFVGLSRGVQRTSLINVTQVAGAAAGLLIAVGLLVTGWGLWSLALGVLARALVALGGGLLFLRSLPRGDVSWWRHPSRTCARDIRSLAPAMSGASVGYVLANNSELLLVTTFFGPVPALVYALTRRTFDGVRNLLDTIAWAVAGGFAHLVTAEDRHRVRGVLHEILWLRLALACLAAAIVVAVNEAFVTLLYGAENFGGRWLTFAFALQMISGGQTFLTNFLLRSTGQVREGSWLQTAEAVVRVVAMAAGLLMVGLAGAPWAASMVSLAGLHVMRRRLERMLPKDGGIALRPFGPIGPSAVFGVGLLASLFLVPSSWGSLGAVALAIAVSGGVILWFTTPAVLRRQTIGRWTRS